MKAGNIWNITIAIGIAVLLIGLAALLIGFDNERRVSDLRTIEEGRVYSFEMQVSSGRAIHVQYSISNNVTMTVLITSSAGHNELLSNGAISPGNEFYRLESTSNGSFNWTPTASGVYYLIFYPMNFEIEPNSQLEASATYFGSLPELIMTGVSGAIIGILVVIVSVLMKNRPPREEIESEELIPASQDSLDEEEKSIFNKEEQSMKK